MFDGDRITLQSLRTCQPVFSAALAGHVEAGYSDEEEKNELCTAIPHPDSDIDWLRITLANALNTARWTSDPDLGTWLRSSRLDAFSRAGLDGPPNEAQLAVLQKIGEHTPGSITNLRRLLGDVEDAGGG